MSICLADARAVASTMQTRTVRFGQGRMMDGS